MSSVFARLGFNFDTNAFGDAQYLTAPALKTLEMTPPQIKDWQVQDLAAGSIDKNKYVKNPHANVCSTLTANVTHMNVVISTASFPNAETEGETLKTECRNYIIELAAFKSHTDNISGLGVQSANAMTIPDYDLAVSVGQQILRITNTTDNVANSTPMLGSFTSLFIGSDLAANNTTIYNDRITLDSSVAGNGNVTLGSAQVNNIISHIQSAKNLISTRRLHDWNFYSNSMQVVSDYQALSRYNNLGNTQTYLVNNLIGTDFLKNNLANN